MKDHPFSKIAEHFAKPDKKGRMAADLMQVVKFVREDRSRQEQLRMDNLEHQANTFLKNVGPVLLERAKNGEVEVDLSWPYVGNLAELENTNEAKVREMLTVCPSVFAAEGLTIFATSVGGEAGCNISWDS